MKASFPNTFARGQKLVRFLLALSIVAALAGLLLYAEHSTGQLVCIFLSLAMMIGVITVIARDCRCPRCGKRIINGVLVLETCPKCKCNLYTGDKVKKSGKKGKK